MAKANIARRQGDDFQARLFWLKAASLLDSKSPVVRVAYETGPKSFDDISIEHELNGAPRDHEGNPIRRKHIQSKWHTTAGVFGYRDLIDPKFINAERHSLLQRAKLAQAGNVANADGLRLELVTNWRLRPDDPLMKLVRKESDAIDLSRLFDATTDKSQMGQVRKLWREHLGVDDDALRAITRTLAVAETTESLASLRERLDDRFAAVGMKRVPPHESSFFYDDLIVKLLGQGRVEFDKDGFREMCDREGLLAEPAPCDNAITIGVRSFMHPIDNLEDRAEPMLNFVPYFDGRYIRDEEDWQRRLLPELRNFLLGAARQSDHLRLIVDAHASLAFACGSLLNVKSGKRIEIEQRTAGRRFWTPDDETPDASWTKFVVSDENVGNEGGDIALAISLTHDVSPAVSSFVKQALDRVARIVHLAPEGGASQRAVRCGRHAWMLAEAATRQMQSFRNGQPGSQRVHIFIAGPNGFTFFLGQHQQAIGPCVLYEWDFDGQRGGGYSRGLSIGG
ncbi:MAG: SAVED domain-containing protein [Woeseia sp.]